MMKSERASRLEPPWSRLRPQILCPFQSADIVKLEVKAGRANTVLNCLRGRRDPNRLLALADVVDCDGACLQRGQDAQERAPPRTVPSAQMSAAIWIGPRTAALQSEMQASLCEAHPRSVCLPPSASPPPRPLPRIEHLGARGRAVENRAERDGIHRV